MIPGNRPEDVEEEAFLTDFETQAEANNIAIPNSALDAEWFTEAILLAKEMGYKSGYNDGRDEERFGD